ncbi:dATP/dGTP pyrophosphohydrolase domain-containing protein, partial [Enterobacter hormaechei]
MSTTLKAWLKQTIAELEEERDATPGAVNEDAAMALEAMKRALASLMADPVAWTDEQELRDVEKYGCGYLFTANPITPNADPHRVIKLYTASPAPMLPEEMPKGLAGQIVSLLAHNIGDKLLAQKIWNACRAAMLQGGEHVTTAYKLPEETSSSLQLRNLIRQRHAEWSQATFGDVGPVGPLKH